jgi:hypothetical protein
VCQAFDSRAFQRVAPTSLAAALADGPHARCAPLRYQNTVPFSEPGARVCYCKSEMVMVKASILVPLRDILTSEPVWQIVFGHEACNAQEHEVSDPSFCTESWPEERTPERVARGGILSCPRALSKGDTIESGGRKLQFIGTPPTAVCLSSCPTTLTTRGAVWGAPPCSADGRITRPVVHADVSAMWVETISADSGRESPPASGDSELGLSESSRCVGHDGTPRGGNCVAQPQ